MELFLLTLEDFHCSDHCAKISFDCLSHTDISCSRDLSGNQLSGSIASEIAKLDKLTDLYVWSSSASVFAFWRLHFLQNVGREQVHCHSNRDWRFEHSWTVVCCVIFCIPFWRACRNLSGNSLVAIPTELVDLSSQLKTLCVSCHQKPLLLLWLSVFLVGI